LRKGRQKLFLYPDQEGDGADPSKTPGKLPKTNEVDRLEKVIIIIIIIIIIEIEIKYLLFFLYRY